MRTLTRSQKGSSLLIALFAVVILSGLGILMVKRGTLGMKDTVNFRQSQTAFEAAEAGAEHARKLLNDGAGDTWDDELSTQAGPDGVMGTVDDVSFITSTELATAQSYAVTILDNTDFDPSDVIDADGRIWIISTGTSGGKTTMVRVLVENESQDAHISQEHYGERSLGWARGEGRQVADTYRGEL